VAIAGAVVAWLRDNVGECKTVVMTNVRGQWQLLVQRWHGYVTTLALLTRWLTSVIFTPLCYDLIMRGCIVF